MAEETKSSVDEVAASLIDTGNASESDDAARDDSPVDTSAESSLEDLFSEGEPDPETDEAADDTLEASDDSPDDFFSEESDDTDTSSSVHDDTTVKVTVDGEEQSVTIAELKRRYAGEGAIEKRLQEATEARKAASEQARVNREQMENIVQAVGQLLFTPSVEPPPPELMQQDPTEYLLRKDMYENEIRTVEQRRQSIQQAMEHLNNEADKALNEVRRLEGEKLLAALPILKDPAKGKKFRDEFVDMLTTDYGFSMDDLNSATDHRLFLVAADALRYKMLRKKSASGFEVNKTKARVAANSASPKTRRNDSLRRQQKKAYEKARQTGSVDDVALTLIEPSSRRRRQ